MMDSQIYKLYKPLRNHLQPVAVENAFYVIWAYMNFLQFNNKFPLDIQVDVEFIKNKDVLSKRALYEWELSLLTREIILHGQRDISMGTKSFQSWNYFSSAINKLKDFENNAWPIFGNNKNVKIELSRVARRQFPWQTKPSSVIFVRYFKIYNNSRVAAIVEKRIGLSTRKWYAIGTVLFGAILGHPKLNIDPKLEVAGLTRDDFDKFLSYVSTDLEKVSEIIKKEIKYDDEFIYSFNPLEYFPFIKIGNFYYCPISTFIVSRITSGIYFDLVNDPGFGVPFGLAFQDYLLEISNKVIDSNKIKVLSERKYKVGKNEKDSVDIILCGKDEAFFVEAKTKRLSAKSRSEFLSQDSIIKDMEVLAEAVVQIYSTIIDYEKGFYEHLTFDPGRKIYPLVVTLEDWFIFGEETIMLKNRIKELMKERDIDQTYLEKMPYTITWSLAYESLIQLINKYSIKDIMLDWFTPDKRENNFGQYLFTKYGKECKYIDDYFPEDFESIYLQLRK